MVPRNTVLDPVRQESVTEFFSKLAESRFFQANCNSSLKAALWTLVVAGMDLFSNATMLILLSTSAPYYMFDVALASLVVSLLADVALCCRFMTHMGNLPRVWLYVLECQEVDPLWQDHDDSKHTAFLIKSCKVFKSFVNTVPAFYVQVLLLYFQESAEKQESSGLDTALVVESTLFSVLSVLKTTYAWFYYSPSDGTLAAAT